MDATEACSATWQSTGQRCPATVVETGRCLAHLARDRRMQRLGWQAEAGTINLDNAEVDADLADDLRTTLYATLERRAGVTLAAARSEWLSTLSLPKVTLGGLLLAEAQFAGAVNLDDSHITGRAELGAYFTAGLTARRATFDGDTVTIPETFFGPGTSFEQATFGGDVSFTSTEFDDVGQEIWRGTTFLASAQFDDCYVRAPVEFVDTRFGRTTTLGFVPAPNGHLRPATATTGTETSDGHTRFPTTAETTLSGARWSEPSEVLVTYGQLRIRRSIITHLLTLDDNLYGRPGDETGRRKSTVGSDGRHIWLFVDDDRSDDDPPSLVELTDCGLLATVVVGDLRLDLAHFAGSTGLEMVRIVGTHPFPTAGRWRRRQVIAEERLLRVPSRRRIRADLKKIADEEAAEAAAALAEVDDAPLDERAQDTPAGAREKLMRSQAMEAALLLENVDDIADRDYARASAKSVAFAATVESVYRQLRAGLEASKASAAAADFYYGELEARRRTRRSRLDFLLLPLYKWVGGYGVRVGPPLIWFVAIVVGTALLLRYHTDWFVRPYAQGVLDGYQLDRFWDALAFVVRNSISFLSAPANGLTAGGTFLFVIERYSAVTVLALTVFAIRSRVVR